MQALAAQAEATLKLTHNVGGAASFLEVATSEEPGVLLERTSYCVKCVVAYFVFFFLLFVWFSSAALLSVFRFVDMSTLRSRLTSAGATQS